MKKMTPKEKGQFLLKYFKNERGDLELNDVDLSDFHGNVEITSWKVGGNLFQDYQEVGGSLYQHYQKVGLNLYQSNQEVGGHIVQQDEQKAEDACVEPNYKAEYKRLNKELCEANRKIETLMWALEKAKEADK